MSEKRAPKSLYRRELLKLSPVLLLGAFAVPRFRDPLLEAGVAFSDWASGKWFRSGHLAPEYPDSEVAAIETLRIPGHELGTASSSAALLRNERSAVDTRPWSSA